MIFFLFALVLLAAIAPLSTAFHGIPIYTPYVPFAALVLWALPTYLRHPTFSIKRPEEFAFVGAHLLALGFSLFAIVPFKAFAASFVGIYAISLFLLTRHFLANGYLRSIDLTRIATLLYFLLTAVTLLQIALHSNIGIIENYFGTSVVAGGFTNPGAGFRASGTFRNPNIFTQVYVTYSSIVLSSVLLSHHPKRLLLALAISVVTLSLVVASGSRSGLLYGITSHSGLFGYWFFRTNPYANAKKAVLHGLLGIGVLLLVVAGGVTAYSYAGFSALSRWLDVTEGGGRLGLIAGAVELLQRPMVALFGVGGGQFIDGIRAYNIPLNYLIGSDLTQIHTSVHHWLLQILVENGALVLVLYSYAVAVTMFRGWEIRSSTGGSFSAMLCILLGTLYLFPLQLTTAATTIWILTPVALILAWIQHEYEQNWARDS